MPEVKILVFNSAEFLKFCKLTDRRKHSPLPKLLDLFYDSICEAAVQNQQINERQLKNVQRDQSSFAVDARAEARLFLSLH